MGKNSRCKQNRRLKKKYDVMLKRWFRSNIEEVRIADPRIVCTDEFDELLRNKNEASK